MSIRSIKRRKSRRVRQRDTSLVGAIRHNASESTEASDTQSHERAPHVDRDGHSSQLLATKRRQQPEAHALSDVGRPVEQQVSVQAGKSLEFDLTELARQRGGLRTASLVHQDEHGQPEAIR